MTYSREQLLEAADVLDKAHDVILERGWWGMRSGNAVGSRCMEAAVLEAATGARVLCASSFSDNRWTNVFPGWLYALLYSRGIRYEWNDVPERTEDDVFERLRSVAKSLREEASL